MTLSNAKTHTNRQVYLVATIRPWNINVYHQTVSQFPGEWHLISDPAALTPAYVRRLAPRYIFFPHWSHIVQREILELSECICFHETDLPYGRGGSPIQNLIVRGHADTQITALRMVSELDAGPVYMKRPLSLAGSAHEIFTRAAGIVGEMIGDIARTNPLPTPQQGNPEVFKRRTPKQSEITSDIATPKKLYDHIRMLDAPEYPKAYLTVHGMRYTFKNARLDPDTGKVIAQVSISTGDIDTND